MDLTARNIGSAWRRIHRWISLIFVAESRSAADLLIGGIGFIDKFLDDEDLELGNSSGV